MHEIKTKQQLLLELVKIQNELEGKVKLQDNMIEKFQIMLEQNGLSSQIISYFPYPLAVFTPNGTLTLTNKVLMKYSNLNAKDVEDGKCSISQLDKLNKLRLSTEFKKVFSGETLLLEDLNSEIPSDSINNKNAALTKAFHKAVLFPVIEDNGTIIFGVVLFMNQRSGA